MLLLLHDQKFLVRSYRPTTWPLLSFCADKQLLVFIDGELKRPRSIRLGGKKQSSSAATSPAPFRFWPELPLVFIDGGLWTTSRWIHLTPGDGTRSRSGRNDLLPLGHKWEHGHGLPVLGRSGVAILLLCWCGSCQLRAIWWCSSEFVSRTK